MSNRRASSQDRHWAVLGGLGQLVIHAIGRHKLLFAFTWVAVVGMSLGLLAVLPKTYEVQTTLQVSPTQVLTSLTGAPQQAPGTPSSAPWRYATETVLTRQNLVDLIRETNLLDEWPKSRAPLPRLKDALWARLFPPPTTEERLDGFVTLLEKRLWVKVDPTTITIGILWPDPDLALKLVEGAQARFFAVREAEEISTIEDGIAILENRASEAREALDDSLRKLEQARLERPIRTGKRIAPALGLDELATRRGSQLQLQVEVKRRDLLAMTEARQRLTSQVESRLLELRAVHAETHPSVVETREQLEALQKESPQILALQQELAPLEKELEQRGLLSEVPLKGKRGRPSEFEATPLESFDPVVELDPAISYAKGELRHAYSVYTRLRDGIQAARLEVDSARAAFKYRYVPIRPAQRPRGPVSPRTLLVAIASFTAGLVLAAFAAAFVDLTSRTFLEDWQVEQALGVPLLGTLPEL
jgi:uncharacterized protein involved in exopolysaccharide biosynthesis